ncbi:MULTISPECIES: sigma-E factor regulatory protein RseB [Enterobacterales]|jgi:sigma-E factor negative regulatory protein RseB|uniref:Sigma E regulatory protein, MucB/RseB n=1 Tax=Candidatus Pantoea symbiotica TaxID=1884370 RepID=A0A1I3W5U9_9GAMM|nr:MULTISPECIES: sigma-E factor regulatory protein RseB [Enterobacterales]MRT23346.1 sigma-E factor regulatory protein RseB [Enterobacteriaceae bacterium RIT697]MRT41816.1 sigma-E factor regulatory protein RseB [Enterobacteriaceae bacterium RIT702]KAJ9432164.1 sigma-E factor regulatory protein RseB [Pantoea sp. YR343]MEA5104568.1 sigma-E factor regulatory protein RseB [Pantoea sp. S18]SFK02855.1 sigma E regulatory protein, MucB/RseB [Pantoea symbiotica]
MKQLWCAVSLLAGSLFCSSIASAQTSASGALLQQMEQASQNLNYEFAYINVSRLGIESLRYRHAVIDNRIFAQLLQMDGPRREVIQRGNDISYFEPGLDPFSLPGNHIIDALPGLMFADFSRLGEAYDFIPVGRSRMADQMCEVVRIVSRDGTRYSYVVWLDVDTKLPLRIDLLDRDGETLEQFRVISFAVDEGVRNLMQGLEKANLPPSLSLPAGDKVELSWQPGWLPAGMKLISQSRRDIPSMNKTVESRLYSDGLFSFAINVTPADKSSSVQALRTGRRTVQTEVRNNNEITVVGELPPATAKRIADSIDSGSPK